MPQGKGKGVQETPKQETPKDGKYVITNRCKHDGKRYEVGDVITDSKVISVLEPLGVFGNVANNNKISTPKGVVGDDK
jgi:hypothetical protein